MKKPRTREKPKDLYDVAKQICHEHGFPWTDPRTLKTHPPPERQVIDERLMDWEDNAKQYAP